MGKPMDVSACTNLEYVHLEVCAKDRIWIAESLDGRWECLRTVSITYRFSTCEEVLAWAEEFHAGALEYGVWGTVTLTLAPARGESRELKMCRSLMKSALLRERLRTMFLRCGGPHCGWRFDFGDFALIATARRPL